MCGIFAIINNIHDDKEFIEKEFMKCKGRGPEFSKLCYDNNNNNNNNNTDVPNNVVGFHRLGINGYNDDSSNQPFDIENITLICNGEIYNCKELYDTIGVIPGTKSDCEAIIHLYIKYGIEQTLNMLDGAFAFVLIDKTKNEIYVARDLYGLRPLFIKDNKACHDADYDANVDHADAHVKEPTYYIASELKSICSFANNSNIQQFPPGHYACFVKGKGNTYRKEYTKPFYISNVMPRSFSKSFSEQEETEACLSIKKSLTNAVLKRLDNTDRNVACLLSGGLDSSLIAALLQKYSNKPISTWSIGMPGSEDIEYARKVAQFIKSDHHEFVLSEEEFLASIEKVIYDIESYDTTTVRASIGNWLIAKKIKENSDNCKVIFNGDGSDELFGGYLYFHCAPDAIEFDKECKRLLSHIHYFDVLRCDRSISSHGLEARTPFLDRGFVENYLAINPNIRYHALSNNRCEKYLLRKAFSEENLVPDEVLWRVKEAFSDGVSSSEHKSWSTVLQQHIDDKVFQGNVDVLEEQKGRYGDHNMPMTREQLYYRKVFESFFQNCSRVIPYFWMPKYTKATDASAKTLDIYKKKEKLKISS